MSNYQIRWENDWSMIEEGQYAQVWYDGFTYAVVEPGEIPGDASCAYTRTIDLARKWANEEKGN